MAIGQRVPLHVKGDAVFSYFSPASFSGIFKKRSFQYPWGAA
jgi:hypothetical protein